METNILFTRVHQAPLFPETTTSIGTVPIGLLSDSSLKCVYDARMLTTTGGRRPT